MIQFVYPKHVLSQEIERIARSDALIALTSVRHSLHKAATPNIAIPPESYGQLFTRPHVIVDENDILHRYLRGKGPNLLQEDWTKMSLEESPLIDIVVSADRSKLKRWGVVEPRPHSIGRIGINPLYRCARNGDGFKLSLNWPSEHFREDNSPMEEYLPVDAELTEAQMEEIRNNNISDTLKPLIDRGVIVDLPLYY